jgi:uncharacterized membrane protein
MVHGLPRLHRLVRALLIRPRRPLRWPAWVALAMAIALPWFAVLAVQLAGWVRFAHPWSLLWLLALPAVWWWWACGWSGLTGTRAGCVLALRTLLIAGMVAVLAEPRAVRSSDALALVFACDVSDSVGQATSEAARTWMIQVVQGKPPTDSAGLVLVGRESAVELPPRPTFALEAFSTRVDKGGTDLERGLALAGAVLPDDRPGRVVLVSDGVATAGDTARAVDQLAARGIPVDVLPIAWDRPVEVWAERLELPREVRPGETYEAAVVLGALSGGSGTLRLRENGLDIAEQRVTWGAGRSRYTLPLRLRGPGLYEYVALIEPEPGRDGWTENNLAMASLVVAGEGRVLVLTDPQGKTADHEPLVKALREAGRLVEVEAAWNCPADPLALSDAESVWLVNVPADALDASQQAALRDAVRDLGTGLVMIGGGNSFGPGGWNRTPVEEALPVTMDITARKVMPKGALAIVLHTCEFADGNTWGKRITKQAMKTLAARDEVGVLAYEWGGGNGGGDRWVVPLAPAADYDRMATLIEAAQVGDMPTFQPILQLAYDGLMGSDAATRHIIIISDGDPSPPTPALMEQLLTAKITVSTVSIFPHGSQEVAAFSAIATTSGGRAYFPQDPNTLPQIFVKEAKTLRRSQIQNGDFTPTLAFPSPIVKGLGAVPMLGGYVLTSPKARAQTVLEGPDAEEPDPVLAWWRFGTGSSAAFTSDLGANWGARWVSWGQYRAFVEQLALAVGRTREPGSLRLAVEADGADGLVTVEDHHPLAGLMQVQAQVRRPDGSNESVACRPVAPGRYQGRFVLGAKGRYQVVAAAAGPNRSERVAGGVTAAYSPEYRRFRADPQALRDIAARTGGRVLTGTEDGATLFGVERTQRSASRAIADRVLAVLAVILLLDVVARRVQLDWAAIWQRLTLRRAAPTTQAMGQLLAAKERARSPTRQMLPDLPAAARPTSRAAPPPTAPPPPKTGGSTAASLLEAKRRRQHKDSQP